MNQDNVGSRIRRETPKEPRKENIGPNGPSLWSVRTCSLYMQADHLLYNQIFNHEGQHDETRYVVTIWRFFDFSQTVPV